MIQLYDYYRSSASYRVRIALELKSIPYELIEVHLVKDGGKQFSKNYTNLNPLQRVPTLVDKDFTLTQSLAIISYLDAEYPEPALSAKDSKLKAQITSFAQTITSDIHPLNNLSVLQYLKENLNVDEKSKINWYHHWIINGFSALEKQLVKHKGYYCFGDEVSLADLCLIPQVYNAIRFDVNMSNYPLILEVYQNCNKLDAFQKASPEYVQQHKRLTV